MEQAEIMHPGPAVVVSHAALQRSSPQELQAWVLLLVNPCVMGIRKGRRCHAHGAVWVFAAQGGSDTFG